jgi:hypothetical protein
MAATPLVTLLCTGGSVASSVLTHEEIVDLVWTDDLSPLLPKRLPALSLPALQTERGLGAGLSDSLFPMGACG